MSSFEPWDPRLPLCAAAAMPPPRRSALSSRRALGLLCIGLVIGLLGLGAHLQTSLLVVPSARPAVLPAPRISAQPTALRFALGSPSSDIHRSPSPSTLLRAAEGSNVQVNTDGLWAENRESEWQTLEGMGTRYAVRRAGTGPVVRRGSTVTVHATGLVAESEAKFWSTHDPGQAPFTYQAGVGSLISGWDR
eukprot:EG_transcript_33249